MHLFAGRLVICLREVIGDGVQQESYKDQKTGYGKSPVDDAHQTIGVNVHCLVDVYQTSQQCPYDYQPRVTVEPFVGHASLTTIQVTATAC